MQSVIYYGSCFHSAHYSAASLFISSSNCVVLHYGATLVEYHYVHATEAGNVLYL